MKDVKQLMIEDMKLRGLAPTTQDRYLHAIKALSEHYHRPLDKITEKQVRKYLLYLIGPKGYAKSTFNIDLAAIKFLYRRTLGRDWSLLKIRGSRANKRLPIVLSRDEMWSLLNLVHRPKPHMCLILMYTCGLRVSEAANLRIDDIDTQAHGRLGPKHQRPQGSIYSAAYPDVDPTATLLAAAPAKYMAFPLQVYHQGHHHQLRATLPQSNSAAKQYTQKCQLPHATAFARYPSRRGWSPFTSDSSTPGP